MFSIVHSVQYLSVLSYIRVQYLSVLNCKSQLMMSEAIKDSDADARPNPSEGPVADKNAHLKLTIKGTKQITYFSLIGVKLIYHS